MSLFGLVALAGLFGIGGPASAQGPAPLFDDAAIDGLARVQSAQRGSGPRVMRSRTARLRPLALQLAAAAGRAGDTSPLLTLNLFPDVSHVAVFERFDTDVLGHETWVGRVADDDLSTVTLTWRGDTIVGGVQTASELYRLHGTMSSTVVEQVDPASFGEEMEPVRVPEEAMALAQTRLNADLASPAAGEIVDILVYYTAAARVGQGGQSAIESLIATAVADANTAYTRSGMSVTLRLVATAELTGYTESSTNMGSDLSYIQSNATVAAGRNTVGADLVSLIVNGVVDGTCGIGYLGPSSSFAHSVTSRTCIVGNYTFAHEVGHNFGSHHAPEDGASGAWKAYAYGYKDLAAPTPFRTVMAYAPGTRILNFSNPGVGYGTPARPTGTATQNNALALSESFPIVQGFRTPSGPPPSAPSAPQNVTATVSGNTVTVSWSAPASGTPSNYVAQVGTTPGGSNIFSGSVGLATSASGALPNGTYYIRLYAQNLGGTSPASNEVVVTVGTAVAVPGAPLNLIAAVSGSTVSVSWNAPATGGAVANYLAQVGTSAGGSNVFNGSVGLATSASGPLGPGTYFVRVYAQNAAGTSAPSNEVTVTVGPACTAPSAPVLSGSKSGSTISISWTTPSGGPVTGFTVQAGSTSGSSGFFNGSVGLTNAVSAAVGNGPYFIRVIANSACGNSAASNEVSLTIP